MVTIHTGRQNEHRGTVIIPVSIKTVTGKVVEDRGRYVICNF